MAAQQPQLSVGLVLSAVQGVSVVGLPFKQALQKIKEVRARATRRGHAALGFLGF